MSQSVQSATAIKRPESFQLKGGLFPMNLLEIKVADISQIQKELTSKVSQAPAFFQNSLIVLGFEELSEDEQDNLDLSAIVKLCQDLGLLPSAIRGGSSILQTTAKDLKLATLPKSRGKAKKIIEDTISEKNLEQEIEQSTKTEPTAPKHTAEPEQEASPGDEPQLQANSEHVSAKVITTPIRSGQQIYAANCDLIILSSVSAGAEVLADGNIHIYGALRGRALAGIKGDTKARIFCSSQEAELVSIAGEFMVDENLREDNWKKAVQIRLKDNEITIDNI